MAYEPEFIGGIDYGKLEDLMREAWAKRLLPGTGKVWSQDDFNHMSLNWIVEGLDDREVGLLGRDTTRKSTVRVWHHHSGEACLRICSRPIADDERIHVIKHLGRPPSLHGIGLECWFNIRSFTNFRALNFNIRDLDGSKVKNAYIQIYYDGTNYKLQYLDETDVYRDIATVNWISTRLTFWFNLKLIVDFDEMKYRSVFLNGETYDLSDYKLYGVATTEKFLAPCFYVVSRANVRQFAYIDDVVITYDE